MKKTLVLIFASCLILTGCGDKKKDNKKETTKKEPEVKVEEKIKIIDMDSKTRPYAVVINNYPSATKVQSGLQQAYMIYEIPIEGGMSRSVALYKDVTDVKLGTIRSARQNHIDYVLENDAIFVHFGWNYKAQADIGSLGINYIDGNSSDPTPFWRENPLGLATEHTVYTNLSKVISYNKNTKKYRTTTDAKPPLKYTTDEVDLSKSEDAKVANNITIPYGSVNVGYTYDTNTKRYKRYVNGGAHTDYFTKQHYDCKNIIVLSVGIGYLSGHGDMAGNSYLNINNIGSGSGYYITNGYARKITWSKESRGAQTKYKYADGTEVEINDGNTWVMIKSNQHSTTIN